MSRSTPAIEDDSVRSLASFIVNARAGYTFDSNIRVQLDVFNLFNAKTNQIEYCYLSRLPGEPLAASPIVMSIPPSLSEPASLWRGGSNSDDLGALGK